MPLVGGDSTFDEFQLLTFSGTIEMAQQAKKRKDSGKDKVACSSKGRRAWVEKRANSPMWVWRPHKLARKTREASVPHP